MTGTCRFCCIVDLLFVWYVYQADHAASHNLSKCAWLSYKACIPECTPCCFSVTLSSSHASSRGSSRGHNSTDKADNAHGRRCCLSPFCSSQHIFNASTPPSLPMFHSTAVRYESDTYCLKAQLSTVVSAQRQFAG